MIYYSFSKVKKDLEKCLDLLKTDDIIITKDDKGVARLTLYHDEKENKNKKQKEEQVVKEEAVDYRYHHKKVSYEEFMQLYNNTGKRYEYIDGKIYLLSSPVYKHQKAVREIFGHFYNWFKDKKCEPLDAPFDIFLTVKNNDKNIVQPDIVVICDQNKIDDKGRYLGVPKLVVEVISDSTRNKDLIRKLNLYMRSGVREYWVVDPESEEISIYEFKDKVVKNIYIYEKEDTVISVGFEGLSIELKNIFH